MNKKEYPQEKIIFRQTLKVLIKRTTLDIGWVGTARDKDCREKEVLRKTRQPNTNFIH